MGGKGEKVLIGRMGTSPPRHAPLVQPLGLIRFSAFDLQA